MASDSATTTRRRMRADGHRSRERILNEAARLATVEGLEGLSISRLAEAIGMSKSGLYAHFDSKQDLQLATIDTAREIMMAVVTRPALAAPRGIRRLRAVCMRFLDYVDQRVFPGGCFYASTAPEMSMRPGPVRDRIAAHQREWMGMLDRLAAEASELGELPAETDPAQLAFTLNAVITAANAGFMLHGDRSQLDRARLAVDELLGAA